jgi:hypothetical protein
VAIPKDVYTGTADELFGFLARSMKEFITRHNPEDLTVGVGGFWGRVRGRRSAGVIVLVP